MNSQQGLGSAGKDCSLRLTNPDSIPAASGFLLVGILSEGWPPHTDGKKSVRHPARGYNTTIRAPFFSTKKKEKKKEGNGISQSLKFQILLYTHTNI